jgi:predicted RNA-binding Zn ribbon-like protein
LSGIRSVAGRLKALLGLAFISTDRPYCSQAIDDESFRNLISAVTTIKAAELVQSMALKIRVCQNKGCGKHFVVDETSPQWYCCNNCAKGIKPDRSRYQRKPKKSA